jgi:DNA-binding SARP family transcriptional activator
MLGGFEVSRYGRTMALPRSRKTRALLAYLAFTGRPQRREYLCELLWESQTDRRAGLRWSLSRLRRILDDGAAPVIGADRDCVWLQRERVALDYAPLRAALCGELAVLPTATLEQLAAHCDQDELLAGLDLHDVEGYQSWCMAVRAEARRGEARLRTELIERLPASDALPHARRLVQLEPYDEAARATLVALLTRLHHTSEARFQLQLAQRRLRELGAVARSTPSPLLRAALS